LHISFDKDKILIAEIETLTNTHHVKKYFTQKRSDAELKATDALFVLLQLCVIPILLSSRTNNPTC